MGEIAAPAVVAVPDAGDVVRAAEPFTESLNVDHHAAADVGAAAAASFTGDVVERHLVEAGLGDLIGFSLGADGPAADRLCGASEGAVRVGRPGFLPAHARYFVSGPRLSDHRLLVFHAPAAHGDFARLPE